jgi:hypothetical protein
VKRLRKKTQVTGATTSPNKKEAPRQKREREAEEKKEFEG